MPQIRCVQKLTIKTFIPLHSPYNTTNKHKTRTARTPTRRLNQHPPSCPTGPPNAPVSGTQVAGLLRYRRRMPGVKLVRDLEDSEVRLARLAEGIAGRFSRGSIHPSELAARINGESDLACRPGPVGPMAPNRFAVQLNRLDLAALPDRRSLTRELERMTEARSMARGRRLEGPVRVWLETDPALEQGTAAVQSFGRSGRRPAWACLTGDGPLLELTVNRSLVGRGGDSDIVVSHDSVSMHHALIWYEGEDVWVRDMDSVNGTFVGSRAVSGATPLPPEGTVGFGAVTYVLRMV